MKRKQSESRLATPYAIWSVLFIVIPLILIVFFSFTKQVDGRYMFTLDNFDKFFNVMYFKVVRRSLVLAFISTVLCLIVGYPTAYIISKAKPSKRATLLLLCILPMWMNFLLRTYAWSAILGKNGFINTLLGMVGLGPINILYTDAVNPGALSRNRDGTPPCYAVITIDGNDVSIERVNWTRPRD